MYLGKNEKFIEFDGALYVGGAPLELLKRRKITLGFIGCLRGLVFDNQVINLHRFLDQKRSVSCVLTTVCVCASCFDVLFNISTESQTLSRVVVLPVRLIYVKIKVAARKCGAHMNASVPMPLHIVDATAK